MFDQTVVRVRADPLAADTGSASVQRDWANATRVTWSGMNLQPVSTTEAADSSTINTAGVWLLTNRWGTGRLDLLSTDRIEVDDLTFEVDGYPEHWPGTAGGWNHTEATLVIEPLYRVGAQGSSAAAARTAATGVASRTWSPR